MLYSLHYFVLNFVPQVKFKKFNFPVWFSKELKNLVIHKRKAHATYQSYSCLRDYQTFSLLRAQYKFESKKCYKSYIERTESTIHLSPKSFWNFVRKNKGGYSWPESVMHGYIFSKGRRNMCELFKNVFSLSSPTVDSGFSTDSELRFDLPSIIHITLDDVDLSLSRLLNVKSVGPDGFSGYFLSMIRSVLCYPLWLVFFKSMAEGVFPDIWKVSSVTSIFKSGDRTGVTNYRPISIINHISKICVFLVYNSVLKSVDNIL